MIDSANIDDELIDLSIQLAGEEHGADMFQEECAEAVVELGKAIIAVNHYRRNRIDKEKLAEEIADVFILSHKLAKIVGLSMVDQQVQNKMRKLRDRLVETLKKRLENDVTKL
jgi:NTP pyrophosphatase (non-canonical NTP hydrolase)